MFKKILLTIYLASSISYSQVATPYTKQANIQFNLPHKDNQDFKDAVRGFIFSLPNKGIIKDSLGNVVWDIDKYTFINSSQTLDGTVNPSLWRQTQLLNKTGLFKVADRIYQIRGADIANMTIIEGDSGIIIVDTLLSTETATAALNLYFNYRPIKSISAIIYTHSHIDHFGGTRGLISNNLANKTRIIAPQGFNQAAFSENIIVGNVMGRRATYMYGNLLIPGLQSQLGCGLALGSSSGKQSLILPTEFITETGQEIVIDGLRFVFLMAPDSEAPAEMLFYIPELKALCGAEITNHTMHNLYTLRGAKIRDAKAWSHYINETIQMFGSQAEVLFLQHTWPVWNNSQILEFLEKQRDLYKYIHDQTLRLANQGYTMIEIAEMITLPKSLSEKWYNRGYYGSLNHNIKSVYTFYLGWFDANPATLHPLPPAQASKKYIEYMGGPANVLKKAKSDYLKGEYRWVAQVLKDLVYAYPDSKQAKNLLADTFEQLGYQAENATWRNFYLSGAKELREGIKKLPAPNPADNEDMINAMPMESILDFLAIHLNGARAANEQITFNLKLPDIKEQYVIQIKNGVLNYFKSKTKPTADFTLLINRDNVRFLFSKDIKNLCETNKLQVFGNQKAFDKFLSLLDHFDFWFNIIQPN